LVKANKISPGLAAPAFRATFAVPYWSRRTTDSMRVSEALDLGSIPNATTAKAVPTYRSSLFSIVQTSAFLLIARASNLPKRRF
jgi:hypothetical protein